ncbi:hypothetical protein [Chitinimonas naiadis]
MKLNGIEYRRMKFQAKLRESWVRVSRRKLDFLAARRAMLGARVRGLLMSISTGAFREVRASYGPSVIRAKPPGRNKPTGHQPD